MAVTLILRLLAGPLAADELVGHVEHVASGATAPVRGADDLVAFARQAAAARPPARPPGRAVRRAPGRGGGPR